ncbi:FAD-binding domain-containing protein OS=Streptomyces glaucescens OX=1907 GN=SGLAU_04905 PE=4 SV=1 [Streptomyces glaucescens]
MRITIAGSGVAGLATAVSLHAAGFRDVTVFEAEPGLRPHGLGLNILPNAVRELDELGLLDAVRQRAIRTRELAMYNPRGTLVWREDRGLAAGYRWPQLSVSRARLVTALAEETRRRLGDGALVTDARLVGLDRAPGRTRAVFTAGRRHEGRRDGSADRRRRHSFRRTSGAVSRRRAAPTNGMTLYRGTVWGPPFLTGESMAVLGDDRRRLILYPIDRDETAHRTLINWVAAFPDERSEARSATDTTAERRKVILRQLGDWAPPGVDLAALIEQTPDIQRYPMIDRDPLPRWTFGGVTPARRRRARHVPPDPTEPPRPSSTRACSPGIAHGTATPGRPCGPMKRNAWPQMTELQRSNRSLGPERVLTMAHRRAPGGFGDVRDVFSEEELAEISRGYAVTGKF